MCSAAPHRSVADTGFGFRHLARSRSGQPLIDVPAQPAAVLRVTRSEPMLLTWPVPPADTALQPARWWERAMPPPHHARV